MRSAKHFSFTNMLTKVMLLSLIANRGAAQVDLSHIGVGSAVCDDEAPGSLTPYAWDLWPSAAADPRIDVRVQKMRLGCAPAADQWYLYEGFVQRTLNGVPTIGMVFNDPRLGVGNLQAMKKFLRQQVLKKDIRTQVNIVQAHDASGKLVRYGFMLKSDTPDQIALMERIVARIERAVKQQDTTHLCPMAKAICDFETYKAQHLAEAEISVDGSPRRRRPAI